MPLHGLVSDEQPVSDEICLFVELEIVDGILIGYRGDFYNFLWHRLIFSGSQA